jgi:hypothetical protein
MAVNTSVFTGADAVLALAIDDPSSVEGTEAQTVIEGFELGAVGRATDVEVYVTTDLRSFHEIGKRLPTQLHQGNINISGKIGRAYINGGLLSLLLGKYAEAGELGLRHARRRLHHGVGILQGHGHHCGGCRRVAGCPPLFRRP